MYEMRNEAEQEEKSESDEPVSEPVVCTCARVCARVRVLALSRSPLHILQATLLRELPFFEYIVTK